MASKRGGDRYSEIISVPELSGRVDEVTTARARRLAEDPASTAEDARRFRAQYAAERVRQQEVRAQLERDVLELLETARQVRQQ